MKSQLESKTQDNNPLCAMPQRDLKLKQTLTKHVVFTWPQQNIHLYIQLKKMLQVYQKLRKIIKKVQHIWPLNVNWICDWVIWNIKYSCQTLVNGNSKSFQPFKDTELSYKYVWPWIVTCTNKIGIFLTLRKNMTFNLKRMICTDCVEKLFQNHFSYLKGTKRS